MSDIEKGYTKKKYRRKIPKVVRWYKRHRSEDKTFDKSEGAMDDIEKGGPGSGRKGEGSKESSRFDRAHHNVSAGQHKESMRKLALKIKNTPESDGMSRGQLTERLRNHERNYNMKKSQENTMAKSIDEQIEEMAKSMETATIDPRDQVLDTISELGPEGLKKALPELSEAQKIVLIDVLEETKKSMDFDQVTPEKKMTRLDQSGAELENGSDDEDEKIVARAEKEVQHQGNADPEGFEGQVIKGKEMDKDCKKEAKKEVDKHEDKMHDKEKMKKMCKSIKESIIKSYEDAGLPYNDELIKSQMKAQLSDTLMAARKASETEMDADAVAKAKLLSEESQVKSADQVEQGEEDKKSDKKECKEIEVGKDADTKADDVKVMKKSIKFDDPNKLLKACTGGRNMHYSVNAHYDDVLAKSKEEPKAEELKKSDDGKLDTNDLIAKGMDVDADQVKTERMMKAHKTNGHLSESFSSVDLLDAMGMTAEEAKEILGE